MNVKKILLMFILILIGPISVKALDADCTVKEQNHLKELVAQTQVTYELYDETSDYGAQYKAFRVMIAGFKPDFYVFNEDNGIYFEYGNDGVPYTDGYAPNQALSLPFYASNQGVCHGFLIATKMVQLPPYNVYSEDPLCVGYETYELCNKYSPIYITNHDEFEQRMNQYIESQKNNNNDDDDDSDKNNNVKQSLWDKITNFLLTYNLFFLLPIIVLGTAGIVIVEVRRRRSIL